MSQSKFDRKRGQRQAFLKGLLRNLIMREKIETTEARAKALRPQLERLVTIAKKQNLAGLRLLIRRLPDKSSAQKLFYEIAPRYKERPGGYLRIIKEGRVRKRDAARLTRIEFV